MASLRTSISSQTQDELDALSSMFPDNFRIQEDSSVQLDIEEKLRLVIHIPSTYPTTDPPIFEIILLPLSSNVNLAKLIATAPIDLLNLFQPDEPVIYEWYQFLCEKLSELELDISVVQKQQQQQPQQQQQQQHHHQQHQQQQRQQK